MRPFNFDLTICKFVSMVIWKIGEIWSNGTGIIIFIGYGNNIDLINRINIKLFQ